MRTFELRGKKAAKFWKAELQGDVILTLEGEVGTAGAREYDGAKDAAQAKKKYDRLIKQKLADGYVETTPVPPPAPPMQQALAALRDAGLLSEEAYAGLRGGYDFLLRVQSRLRIVHNRSLDEVPEEPAEVEKLARRLGFDSGVRFLSELERHTARTRELFLRLMARERETPAPA